MIPSLLLISRPKDSVLHGGVQGWDTKALDRVDLSGSSANELFSPKEVELLHAKEQEGSAGVWTITSPDGDGGHVGTVVCQVGFVLLPSSTPKEVGQIIVIYRAKLLDKSATALNLTHHWGFNLAASGISQGRPTPASEIGISDHNLQLKSKHILNLDPTTSLPTGTLLALSTPSAAKKDFGGRWEIGNRSVIRARIIRKH